MDKSRANRVEHDKKRIGLIALVAIFSVSICVLGSMIGYKIYTKQSFEQRIETLKKEKDDQLSEGNQKDHFRKGQAEVIAYYPLQGEQVISSLKEIMTQDIKENLEDKENLVFYYTEKQDSTLKGIVNRSVMKQVYDLTSSKVEETEKTSLAKVHLTEDGKPFTLDQLFSDPSKAKEQLLKEITSFLQDKKLDQEKIDQVVKGFSDQDLSGWNFDYKDSQIILYPSQSVENLDEIALPVSSFFDVVQSSYLLDKDAELYKNPFKLSREVVSKIITRSVITMSLLKVLLKSLQKCGAFSCIF